MPRRKSLRSQLYRAARDLGNVEAAEKGPDEIFGTTKLHSLSSLGVIPPQFATLIGDQATSEAAASIREVTDRHASTRLGTNCSAPSTQAV